jgi:ubiquinone/menaquinone biosynthesis C-methylase UbiE
MVVKILGVILILIGIAGIFLPILPGLIFLTIGVLTLLRDRLGEIRAALPESIPDVAAVLYDKLIPKMLSRCYKEIADEVDLKEGETLLDIGTGPGVLAIAIAAKFPNAKIIGIDLSGKMIEIANRNKLRRTPDAVPSMDSSVPEFKIMDAKSLEFPDNTFDVIISTGSLHHWKKPVVALDEIYRCLKQGREAWIYDGYAGAATEDIHKYVKRFFKIFPPASLVRYILEIHGYAEKEYNELVRPIVRESKFKTCDFERRGIMMRLRLRKDE